MSELSFGVNVNAPAPLARPGAGNGGFGSDAMPTLSLAPRFTFLEWRELSRAMMRDKSYVATPLGSDVVEYLAWKRLDAAERTLDQYERDLRLVCLAIPEGVAGITHTHLQLVLEAVPEPSRKRVRAAWSDFFRWAVADGRRPDNPVARLPRLRKAAEPVYDLWTQDELDLLIAGTRRQPYPRLERLRVQTMIESGARASELIGMRLGDFELVRKTVTLRGKGRKQRLIPISPELARLVDEYLLTPYPEAPHRDPFFSDHLWFGMHRNRAGVVSFKPERTIRYNTFNAWWHRMERAAGVRHRKPHMTRHTFATDVLDATEGDIYAVKELLGHASIKQTETYLHSSRLRKTVAIDKLGEYRRSRQVEPEPA